MNKQQLAAKIWESANQMRSKIEANEYKDYILGFIFYKYLSDKQLRFARGEDFSDDDIRSLFEKDTETVDHIKSNIGYFIAYSHLFSTWIEEGADFDVSHVRDALSAFSRLIHPDHKGLFEKIFATLETGLSKLGESAAKQTKAISDLIQLIKEIPTDGRQGYDVLGFIYEYLIGMFAANAGKKAGEFYTPHEVSLLMSEIIAGHVKDKSTIQIYDSCSGSGSLLLNIGRSIAKHMGDKDNIKYYAQELKSPTYNLTRMNLVMRDILPTNIVAVGLEIRAFIDAMVDQERRRGRSKRVLALENAGTVPRSRIEAAMRLQELAKLDRRELRKCEKEVSRVTANGVETIVVRDNQSFESAPQRFMRLQVMQ